MVIRLFLCPFYNSSISFCVIIRGMNRHGLLFLSCIFLVCSLPALIALETIPQDSYIETDGNGLTVNSIPSGSKVYIDGILRGITPLSLPSLAPGKYQLVLVKEGYETRTVLVTMTSGKHLDLTLVLTIATGQLLINLERAPGAPGPEKLPLKAELFVDDIKTDTAYLKLPVGLHRIRVEAFGWETAEKTVMVFQDMTSIFTVSLQPASFRVSGFRSERERLNPHNPGLLGATDIAFSVTAAGKGRLTIYDSKNNPVYVYELGPFTRANQRWTWKGTDEKGNILGDGTYTVVLTATSIPYDTSEPLQIDERIFINIDSSLVIRPWSIGTGGSGLLYLSIPETLAPLSFQMDTRLALGFPYGAGSAFSSVPFSFGMRFAPADRWELALSGEFDASREPLANQFTLALRKTLLSPSQGVPLAVGADLSWTLAEVSSSLDPTYISWSGSQGGPRLGLSFLLPLGDSFGAGLSPALVWPMDMHSFSSSPIPDVELGAGITGAGKTITGGLSAKMLWETASYGYRAGPIMGAAELHWFPKPSVFVFHLAGGLWQYQERIGSFASIGLGIIH